MDKQEFRKRLAELLLPELKAGRLAWYYISLAGAEFHGGFLVRACGPINAGMMLHQLGWYVPGCETLTSGPITPEIMSKIPQEMRWRRLSQAESMSLGK